MSKIINIIKNSFGYSAKSRNFSKGDYVGVETFFNIFTNDGRECVTDRKGMLSMLKDIVGEEIKNVTPARIAKLIGTTLKESTIIEEAKRH
ncbi:MAG: hypothetical protein HDS02_07325 [Bacteroides sp.]|nr:hypothetical protein [Bacteroides sp.]